MPMDLLCRLQSENRRLKEERERHKSALEYYAKLKWFVDDGKYIYKVAENALSGGVTILDDKPPCTFPDCMRARAVREAGEEYQRGVAEGLRLAEEAAEDIPTTVSVHATAHDASVATRCKEAIVMAIGAVNATAIEEKPILAKHQPCGCVICTCEENEENRCMGCGAKNCGTHPVGQFPSPLYEVG